MYWNDRKNPGLELVHAKAALDQAARTIGQLRAIVVRRSGVTHQERWLASSAIYGLRKQHTLLSDLYREMKAAAPESNPSRWKEFQARHEDFLESARRHLLNTMAGESALEDAPA
jgi:hypothetical protein